jgi:hypothetical protein
MTQNYANRPTINTPWGSQSWQTQAGIDPSTGQSVTQWTQNTNLTPQSQAALDELGRRLGPAKMADLEARGYKTNKIDENVQAEIMQVVLDDARESYDKDIILELPSCAVDDVERNAQTIEQRLRALAGSAGAQ